MSTTVHLFAAAASSALSSLSDVGLAVVGVFALGVGVMDDQRRSAGRRPQRRPLQHFEIAVGVAERGDRAAADVLVDADGLAGLVVDEVDLRQRNRTGLPSRISNLRLDRRADDLLGRDAVDPLGPRAHELDAAAGDDEGLEAVGAQVGEQLQHRLVDQLGVGPLEPRMARGGEPVRDDRGELVASSCRRASPRSARSGPARRTPASAFMSPSSTALNGCLVFQSGFCGASALTRSSAKANWTYIGCSHHSVPSLSNVAMRSAGGTKSGAALRRDARDEIDDRLSWPRPRSTTAADRSGPAQMPSAAIRSRVGKTARVESRTRRLRPRPEQTVRIHCAS